MTIIRSDERVTPAAPINFLQDFFGNCGVDVLGAYLRDGSRANGTATAAAELVNVIGRFNTLKAAAEAHGGQVTPEENEAAVQAMFDGFLAMRQLGALS